MAGGGRSISPPPPAAPMWTTGSTRGSVGRGARIGTGGVGSIAAQRRGTPRMPPRTEAHAMTAIDGIHTNGRDEVRGVRISGVGAEIPPDVITTAELEERAGICERFGFEA